MRETEALIDRVWQVAPGLQRLELSVDAALSGVQPGQSLLALTHHDLLREQWIPVSAGRGQLTVERPMTQNLAPGQVVNLLGPVGTPLPWKASAGRHLLLIAQETSPLPLLMLAGQAVEARAEVALVLLGEAASYPPTAIPPAVEVITGETNWPDQTTTLAWADQIFVVSHEVLWPEMLANLTYTVQNARGKIPVDFLHAVFNLPLPCGTGACLACMVRCKTANKLLCLQGPSLDVTEVLLT